MLSADPVVAGSHFGAALWANEADTTQEGEGYHRVFALVHP
jgi:hypothetical protein